MNNKKLSYLAAVLVAVLAVVGIAVGVNHSSSSSNNHNATDVAFAQNMIPHHEQAVEMAQYVNSRSSNPQVKALAAKIEAAQSPEIKEMTGWLTSWHQSVPSNQTGMGGMGAGSAASQSGMQGMMSDADMTSLQTLNGTAFDKMWLTMMTAHHTGAIDMATTERSTGTYPAAESLASSITSSQSAQIAQMKQLLTQL